MPELLLRADVCPNDCSWVAHRVRPGNWARRTYIFRFAIEEWYLPPTKPRQRTSNEEIPPEEINNLLGEVRKLSGQLSQVSKNLDTTILQLKANREAIDQGKMEISQIKRELNLG